MYKQSSEYKSIQKKLVAAVAMVLVACIMVVSSSYAWFTLSTAPEVKGITTSVGSNGNLEMALRTGDVSAITSGEGISLDFPDANKYWGNLVDLEDASYGLSSISLAPARLNASGSASQTTEVTETVTVEDPAKPYVIYETNAEVTAYNTYKGNVITGVGGVSGGEGSYTQQITYKVSTYTYKVDNGNGFYLMTPTYGVDGRISAITANAQAGKYNSSTKTFEVNQNGYGVRALGVISNLSAAEIALRDARNLVYNTIRSAGNAAGTSMSDDGAKLADIIVLYAMDNNATFGDTERNNILTAIANLEKIVVSLENALDQAVIAVGVQQGLTITDVSFVSNAIVTKNGEETVDVTWGDDLTNQHAKLKEAYIALDTLNTKLATAKGKVPDKNTAGTDGTGSYTFDSLKEALNALMDTSAITFVVGDTTYSYKDVTDNKTGFGMAVVSNGTQFTMQMGTGIYADIAAFVGLVTGGTTMYISPRTFMENVGEDVDDIELKVTMKADPAYANTKPEPDYHLVYVNSWLSQLTASSDSNTDVVKSLTDLYGYIIDFAFRTNASGSSLMLQTTGKDRVSETYGADSATLGSGSYMEFTLGDDAGYTLDQMIDLMGAIRVVIFDGSSNILGIAALDLGYTTSELTNISSTTELEKDGTITYNGVTYVIESLGDMTESTENEVTTYIYATVTVQAPNYTVKNNDTVSAELYLHEYSIATSGKLTLGAKVAEEDAALMELKQNEATAVSALVYLDGDYVDNGDVAISGDSMTGTMNLQFSSSADLVPMDYTFETEKLGTPTAQLSDSVLTITKHAEAPSGVKYTIYATSGGFTMPVATVAANSEGDNTEVTLPSDVLGQLSPGDYTVTVVASATGYTDSEAVTAGTLVISDTTPETTSD